MRRAWLVALLAGGATVFAFAPFGLFALAFPGLGVLVWLLAGAARARAGFALGFAWGFGAEATRAAVTDLVKNWGITTGEGPVVNESRPSCVKQPQPI